MEKSGVDWLLSLWLKDLFKGTNEPFDMRDIAFLRSRKFVVAKLMRVISMSPWSKARQSSNGFTKIRSISNCCSWEIPFLIYSFPSNGTCLLLVIVGLRFDVTGALSTSLTVRRKVVGTASSGFIEANCRSMSKRGNLRNSSFTSFHTDSFVKVVPLLIEFSTETVFVKPPSSSRTSLWSTPRHFSNSMVHCWSLNQNESRVENRDRKRHQASNERTLTFQTISFVLTMPESHDAGRGSDVDTSKKREWYHHGFLRSEERRVGKEC